MISRRSFFSGLAAALVAPKLVQRVLQRFGWQPVVMGVDFGRDERTIITLLHERMDESYRAMQRAIAEELYGDNSRVLVERSPGTFQYITLREHLMERSERHFQRAAWWRIQGKPDYAMGSLHKAARAENRARSLPA